MREYLEKYFYHLKLASAIAVIALPYVWLTNQSATRIGILAHGLLLWILTPPTMALVDWLLDRFQIHGSPRVLWGGAFYTLALIASSTLMVVVFHLKSAVPYDQLVVPPLFTALLPVFTLYLISLFFIYWQKQQRLELSLKSERNEAAFKALSAQLKPHFFFNSLNTLEYLIDGKPGEAKQVLRQLAQIYRKILEHSDRSLIPFSHELEVVKSYIEVQKFRFGDRLGVQWDIGEGVGGVLFPPNMLLNAVENSLKHGVESSSSASPVILRAKMEGELMQVQVENHFTGTSGSPGTGFGLRDMRERLELLFGSSAQASLDLDDSKALLRISIQRPNNES